MKIQQILPPTSRAPRRLAALFCVTLVGCGGGEAEGDREIVRPAKLVEVEASESVRTVRYPAIIGAASSVDVTFQVGGLLREFPIVSGQTVQRGTLIGRLDARDFQNELATAQAQFDRAESDFARSERLLAENATSVRAFEQARSERDVARASLDIVRKRVEDATLRSPFDGIISAVHVEQFQNVTAQEPIVTLQTTGAAEAEFQVSSTIVATSGQFETEEMVVLLDAVPDLRIPAVFQSVSTEADPQTLTFEVKVAFEPPVNLVVLPGMTGTVESRMRSIGDDGVDDLPAVPTSAVLSDGQARYVWVVDMSTMRVSRREVTLEAGVGERLAVLDGLEAGEVIVGAGASYLHEGMQVRPYEP